MPIQGLRGYRQVWVRDQAWMRSFPIFYRKAMRIKSDLATADGFQGNSLHSL